MRKFLLTGMLVLTSFCLFSQKTVFKPAEWSRAGTDFYGRLSDTRSYQSANFVIYWGDAVGTDPTTASPADRRFSPKAVCDTLEFIYKRYISELKFCSDAPTTNLGKYKIIIVMLGTFGASGPQGFAFGGSYEGTIGAMWVDPSAVKDGGALSHELMHSLQNMIGIQENPNAGGGFVGYDPAGFFYEGHANYMRSLVYPKMAITDVPRWFGTRHFHWSSTRHHYANYRLLYHLGNAMTTRLWKESIRNEHPLVTLRRLKGYTQVQLNDYLYEFVRREPTLDYAIDKNDNPNTGAGSFGAILRAEENRIKNQEPHYQWKKYTLLSKVAGSTDRYVIPDDWAPQDYGFNIIPLYPTCTTGTKVVTVKFKGHTEANTTAGWRYGFVTAKSDGTISRYSPTYSGNEAEISFELQTGETQMFLVVMGAPSTHTSYVWEPGWTKIKRYPYEVRIANALPEGYQSNFRAEYKTNGKVHSNGGGWITNGTTIASTVYVGPNAIVRGGNYSGNVRIEGTAWVEGATMGDNVVIKDNAVVRRGTYSGSAVVQNNAVLYDCTVNGTALIKGNALEFGVTFGGPIVVGGDAEIGSCSNGVYLQFPHGNNGRTDCDGKGATDASNVDVNAVITQFTDAQMAFSVTPTCGGVTNQLPAVSITNPVNNASFISPASITINANASDADGTVSNVQFFNGTTLLGSDATAPYSFAWTNVAAGSYTLTAKATDNSNAVTTSAAVTIVVNNPNAVPAVSITSPVNNATFTAPASIAISANASDADGTVNNVEFLSGTTVIGSDATSPYSFAWGNVASGTYTITARATDNSGAVTTSTAVTITVKNPNTAPSVSITAPANNATFTAPASITISANASDADGTVNNVEFYNGTSLLGRDTIAPYSFAWSNVAAGTYTITAKATDNSGAVTTSTAVTITVKNPNTAPTVSITVPANNATFTAPASITITANAADADGSISNVEFFNGTTLLGIDTTAPYSFVWGNVSAGTYTLAARATDNSAAVTTSSAVTIVVNACSPSTITPYTQINGGTWQNINSATVNVGNSVKFGPQPVSGGSWNWSGPNGFSATTREVTISNIQTSQAGNYVATYTNSGGCNSNTTFVITVNPVNQVPVVSIATPANGATFTAPASITITANATDADGSISNVQFFNGTILLGNDATSPYSFVWTNVASGTYNLTAVATDNAGATTTSVPVSVIVNSVPVNTTIQAETACNVVGILNETVNGGYRGTGYVNTDNQSGTSVAWNINSPVAQTLNLTFRFANAPATNRTADLKVNGVTQVSAVSFVTTGAWTTWNTVTVQVNLTSGDNTIQLVALTSAGCANIDELTFSGNVSSGSCGSILKIASNLELSSASVSPNPAINAFQVTVQEQVQSYTVLNGQGAIVLTGGEIGEGGSVILGDNFASGIYVIYLQYTSGRTEQKKVQKL